jgi:hypothetical protein
MDPYQILGISKNATKEQVRAKYKELAKIHHPDKNKNKDSGIFETIKTAHDTIINGKSDDAESPETEVYNFLNEIKSKCKNTSNSPPPKPEVKKLDLTIDKINKMKKVELLNLCKTLNLVVDSKATKETIKDIIITSAIPTDDYNRLKEAKKAHNEYLTKLEAYETAMLNGELLPFPEF